MFKILTPTILIILGIGGFIFFVGPSFSEIKELRNEVSAYNEALDNSKSLENERDKLTKKYSSFSLDDLDRLEKLLPNNVDNIRLILEIEKLAAPYGMVLKNVKYNIEEEETNSSGYVQGGDIKKISSNKDYGVWNLEFSTEGKYDDFLSFVSDLESNLRIVDIGSIQFSSDSNSKVGSSSDVYEYGFKIKTYWMLN